jgi:hypothetical protein
MTNIPSIKDKIPFKIIVEKLRPGFSDHVGEDCFNLLEGLLEPIPDNRLTATDALKHRFLI